MPDENISTDSSSVETPDTVDATASAETTDTPQAEASAPSTDNSDSTTAGNAGEPVPETGKKSNDRGAESRIKQLLAEVKTLKQQMAPVRPADAKAPEAPQEPQLDNFATFADYQKAQSQYFKQLSSYEAKKAFDEGRTAEQRARDDQAARARNAEISESWTKRAEDTLKRSPKFDGAKAVQAVQPNPTLEAFLIHKSDIGPDILDYLHTHPDEAQRFRDMDPWDTHAEALKLESQLLDQIQGKTPKTPPKPPRYVTGGGGAPKARTAAEVLYGS